FADRITAKPVVGRVFARVDSLPHGVFAALFGAGSGGDKVPTKEKTMADQPVAATIQEIKTAFPKAKSDFVVRCLMQSLPMASVAAQVVEETMTENESLAAKVSAMEEELIAARAQLDELSARAKAMEGEGGEGGEEEEVAPQAKAEDD